MHERRKSTIAHLAALEYFGLMLRPGVRVRPGSIQQFGADGREG
jgi:hypothetical protein